MAPVFYLEIPPFLFGRVVEGLSGAGLTDRARVVVEKPFGHDRASAMALNAAAARASPRGPAVPHRPLPGKMGLREVLYLRFANTLLEPVWNRHHVGAVEITMAEDRGRGPRPLLRPGGRAATSWSTT